MPVALDLRLPPRFAAAADKAGLQAGLTRHAWILATLDCAAGLQTPQDAQGPRPPDSNRPRSTRVKVWLIDERARAYGRAAADCSMDVARWATTVIGVACGESPLMDHLTRLQSPPHVVHTTGTSVLHRP